MKPGTSCMVGLFVWHMIWNGIETFPFPSCLHPESMAPAAGVVELKMAEDKELMNRVTAIQYRANARGAHQLMGILPMSRYKTIWLLRKAKRS